jgi:bacteriorhodopsin
LGSLILCTQAAYTVVNGTITASGVEFNDAYRCVEWLLTVPLVLVELILAIRLSPSESTKECVELVVLAAVMVGLGHHGEIATDAQTRLSGGACR